MNNVHLTIDRRVAVVRHYSACGENAMETVRRFRNQYAGESVSRQTVVKINDKFDQTGSVRDLPKSGRPRTGRSDENLFEVTQKVLQSPQKSTRRMSAETGISHSSVARIMKKDLKFKSFIPRLVQELNEDDFDRRLEFAEEWVRQADADPTFVEHVLWSDEAIFRLNGHVNRHNCVYWSDVNPRITVERPFQSPGLMVWAGVISDRLIGPFFFDDGTVTGQRYLTMLEDELWPEIADRDDIDTMFFQQDGAPPHYAAVVRNWLNESFDGRWIGRRGPIEWPPRSPDMTPLDFWLWGYLKELVYGEKPQSIEDLKRLITEKMNAIPAEMIANVCASVTRRMNRCIELEGRQIVN
jgi:hypothetical protein